MGCGCGCRCVWIATVLMLVSTVTAASSVDTICADAIKRLMPCRSFLDGTINEMTVPCCDGVAAVDTLMGADSAMLNTACKCLKQAAIEMKVKREKPAIQINELCKADRTFRFYLDPNVNCDRV